MERSKESNSFHILAVILAVIIALTIIGGVFLLIRPQTKTTASKNAADNAQTLETITPEEGEIKLVESISVSADGASGKAEDSDKTNNSDRTDSSDTPEEDAEIDAPAIAMDKVSAVHASSELSENGMTHSAGRICDGRLENAWVEGASGAGVNESVVFTFDGEYKVSGMNINAGYQKNQDIYYKNARPQSVKLTFSDGSSMSLDLGDICGPQNIAFGHPVKTSEITIAIESVYPGNKYEDLAISEIAWY